MRSILFVCTGNICRSPTAEAVMRHLAAAQGADIVIDSAGTHGYHTGEAPDRRAMATAAARGISMAGQAARPVKADDFDHFDMIFAMDSGHLRHLRKMQPPGSRARVELFLDYHPGTHRGHDVPDPYYGADRGFEEVIDMITEACEAILRKITFQKS